MKRPSASMILLLVLGAWMLMLGFSGRFKDIFSAAFPSLGISGGSGTSTGASSASSGSSSGITTNPSPTPSFADSNGNLVRASAPQQGAGAFLPRTGVVQSNGFGGMSWAPAG